MTSFRVWRGGPAAQQRESFRRSAAGLGGEHGQSQAGVGGDLHHFVGEVKLADDWMLEAFVADLVVADVVRRPPLRKWLATRR